MRVALFGGSFDPPHSGHLRIALAARERLALDQVLLAPVGRQPLKSHKPAPFVERMRMLALLTGSHARITASPLDAPEPDAREPGSAARPNYTVDTLARLRLTLPSNAELFFLAGADSFLTLPHWREPEALLRPAVAGGLLDGWILAARPGFSLETLPSALPAGYALGSVSEQSGPVLVQGLLNPAGLPATPLYLLPDLDDPSTATRIREAFTAGAPAPYLTPEVARYIAERGLYR